jgi:hypothetical protein
MSSATTTSAVAETATAVYAAPAPRRNVFFCVGDKRNRLSRAAQWILALSIT